MQCRYTESYKQNSCCRFCIGAVTLTELTLRQTHYRCTYRNPKAKFQYFGGCCNCYYIPYWRLLLYILYHVLTFPCPKNYITQPVCRRVTLRVCFFNRCDPVWPVWPPEKLFFYSVGPRVHGVLLSRSDRAKWFGPKRPTKPINGFNLSMDSTVLLLLRTNQRSGCLVKSGLTYKKNRPLTGSFGRMNLGSLLLLLLLLLSVIVHKAQHTTRVATNKKHAMLCIKKEG